jgi:hypothetical protein
MEKQRLPAQRGARLARRKRAGIVAELTVNSAAMFARDL